MNNTLVPLSGEKLRECLERFAKPCQHSHKPDSPCAILRRTKALFFAEAGKTQGATRAETLSILSAGVPGSSIRFSFQEAEAAVTDVYDSETVDIIIDPQDFLRTAERLKGEFFKPHLIYSAGDFHHYGGTHYQPISDIAMRAKTWKHLATCKVELEKKRNRKSNIVPFRPSSNSVSNVLDALRACANIPDDVQAPAWLSKRVNPPAPELLPFNNGLLHLPTGELMPHTPDLFATYALPFNYDPSATAKQWLAFLCELWPDDPDSIETLQMMVGYFLAGETHLQKIFALIGPKRAGKGTIARILIELFGPDAVCGPTLSGLANPFGLQSLIGKKLAVISDARLSARVDQTVVTERLLSISGEDSFSVPRKYNVDWHGRLSTRFLILTNELPRLQDSSGALASRFIVLTLTRSFFGKEDFSLASRLIQQLPGIANWAIEGWKKLQVKGRIETPRSSMDTVAELEDLGSPVAAFVRDRCEVGASYLVKRADLYSAWCCWCDEEGRQFPGSAETFGRDLRAAVPGLCTSQHRESGARTRIYTGIRLKFDLDDGTRGTGGTGS